MRVSNFGRVLILAMALVFTTGSLSLARTADEYKIKVYNNTKSAIKELEVSVDGKEWGYFDIGSGIPPGQTVTLVWEKSRDNEDCQQYFKVQFADGKWSKAVNFNFCEKGLVLEFN